MPTTASPAEIRDDFDAMAPLMPERLGPHESWLLRHLPERRERALEIGCGSGTMARRLAESFAHVDAIDFSPAMISEAERRAPSTINFACADLFDWLRERPDTYDCIVTIATLHHVDLGAALRAMASSLKPGGRLLALDVMHRRNPIVNAAALIAGFRPTHWKLRRAFRRHGRNETYLTIDDARRIASEALPGAQVRAHFFFRYSIIWEAA
jgi:2-polyprenyl-3-methyl-5-hydroxy-6-metoxy-1,4-benzoquinol methylase